MEGLPAERPDDEPARRADALAAGIRALCDAWDRGEWTLAHDRALATLVPGLADRRTPPTRAAFYAGCTRYQILEDEHPQVESPAPPPAGDTDGEVAYLQAAVARYLSHDGQDMCWEHIRTLRASLPEHRGVAGALEKPDANACMRLCAVYRAGVEAGLRPPRPQA